MFSSRRGGPALHGSPCHDDQDFLGTSPFRDFCYGRSHQAARCKPLDDLPRDSEALSAPTRQERLMYNSSLARDGRKGKHELVL